MTWLRFLSKLAFICGVFFLLALSLLFKPWVKDESLVSTIIVIGYYLGLIIMPITIISYLLVWIFKRKLRKFVPGWLVIANLFFLIVLGVYILYENGYFQNFTS